MRCADEHAVAVSPCGEAASAREKSSLGRACAPRSVLRRGAFGARTSGEQGRAGEPRSERVRAGPGCPREETWARSAPRLARARGLRFHQTLRDLLSVQARHHAVEQALPHADEGVALANAHVRGIILADSRCAERLV